MFKLHSIRPAIVGLVCIAALGLSAVSTADDLASFATGGYARGLRSEEMMHKVDTNGDGMVSKEEWVAFQEKVFAMLDKHKTGVVDAKEFVSPGGGDIASFATGGYARGLRSEAMMHKIDTDSDGTVSHDEFIAYQIKVFDMMDTSTTHKGMIGHDEMFATGGANRR
jgi:EF hand/EF-hand domain pair